MLSNKLTFSLSFIVMLVFGLALMVTTAEAGFYTSSLNANPDPRTDQDATTNTWMVHLYLPITPSDVEFIGGGNNALAVIDPAIELDTGTGDLTDMVLGNVRAGGASVTMPMIFGANLAGDPETGQVSSPTRPSLAKFARYVITLEANTLNRPVSFQYSDYSQITLRGGLLMETGDFDGDSATDPTTRVFVPNKYVDTSAVGLQRLSAPLDEIENSIPFTIDPEFGLFKVLYDLDAEDLVSDTNPGGAIPGRLGNGIRIGPSYVPDDAADGVDLPDLTEFFRQGGTIRVVPDTGSTITSGIYITEVMWGHDGLNLAAAPYAGNQWVEVYYQGAEGAAEPAVVNLRLEFIYGRSDTGGIDYVSNIALAQWEPKGQSGHSEYGRFNGEPPVPIVSMYRKRAVLAGGTPAYDPFVAEDALPFLNGALPGSWEVSQASVNMSGPFTGSPGSAHLPTRVGTHDIAVTEILATPLRFSEIRNDGSADDVDWIEIENVSDEPVPLRDYEITAITGVSRADLQARRNYLQTDPRWEMMEHDLAIVGRDDFNGTPDNVDPGDPANDVKRFPVWELPAKAFLLIVNRDPSDTHLASGKNIEILADPTTDDKTTNHGTGFYYFVASRLDLSGNPLLLIRDKVDKNETADNIIDAAGAGRYADHDIVRYNFNTDIWPLKGTSNIEKVGPNFTSAGTHDLTEGAAGEWWKRKASSSHGVGYDKGVDLRFTPGTPGYANDATKASLVDAKGTSATADDEVLVNGDISISEIMFDASVHAGNERWNLKQWVEIYNSSMTEAVNLNGWELLIQNSDDHVDSFVDSSFIFGDAIILPNQTLLLVSAGAANDGISDNQIYNLYDKHARALGLANRRANLLSPEGFYLRLSYMHRIDGKNERVVVDEVGNVSFSGRQRSTAAWEAMPPSEGPVRYSLIRQYGTRTEDGNGPDAPAVGILEDGWLVADLDGGGATFYGHRDDVATPGFRQGGPLPVSLASFRPVRNDAGAVVIKWITASELNNAGFYILRSQQRKGEFKVINPKMIAGAGTTSERNIYTFTDTTANPNVVYYYQIEDVSFDGRHQTLTTQRLKGHVSAGGKLTTTWSDLKRVK